LTLVRDYTLPRFSQVTTYAVNFFTNIFRDITLAISSKIYEGYSWEMVSRAFINSVLRKTSPAITMKEVKEWIRISELIWKIVSLE